MGAFLKLRFGSHELGVGKTEVVDLPEDELVVLADCDAMIAELVEADPVHSFLVAAELSHGFELLRFLVDVIYLDVGGPCGGCEQIVDLAAVICVLLQLLRIEFVDLSPLFD